MNINTSACVIGALFCLAITALLTPPLLAQSQEEQSRQSWITIGVGGQHQLESSLEVSFSSGGASFYRIEYEFSGTVLSPFTSEYFLPDPNGYSVHALSLRLGAAYMKRWFGVAASAGPALVGGAKPGANRQPGQEPDEATDSYLAAGLGAGAELYVKPSPGFGIGVALFANFNPVYTLSGTRFSLYMRMPQKKRELNTREH